MFARSPLARSRVSLVSVVTLGCLVGLPACSGCGKKPTTDTAKPDDVKPKSAVVATPAPKDLLAEFWIKDPDAFTRKVADGSGMAPMLGADPFAKILESVKDESAKKLIGALDIHAGLALAATYSFIPEPKLHAIAAAQLKSSTTAAAALAAAVKAGDLKSSPSKVLDATVYEPGAGGTAGIVVIGDTIVVGDTRDTLEDAAKYVAWISASGPSAAAAKAHDAWVHLPLATVMPAAKSFAELLYTKVSATDVGPHTKAELDKWVPSALTIAADMGDTDGFIDVADGNLIFDSKQAAKGAYGAWLGSFPTGDASPLLTMPKGESAQLFRFTDGLGPLLYAAIEEHAVPAMTVPEPEKKAFVKALHGFGASLGHEIVYAQHSGPATGGIPEMEIVLRADLLDAAGAKASLPMLVDVALKVAGGTPSTAAKITRKPLKDFGAEGETVVLDDAGTKASINWAIRGSYVFLDFRLGTSDLLTAVLDPASTGRLDSDAAAKAKISSWPSKGLIVASYSDGGAIMRALGGGGGGLTVASPAWSYGTASATESTGRGQMPLAAVGGAIKTLMGLRAMGMGGGTVSGPAGIGGGGGF